VRRGRSLRTRLFAAIVLVAAGVLGLSSLATYTLVRRSIEDKALDDLRRRSAALAEEGNRLVVALPPNPANPQTQTEQRGELRNQVRRTLDVSDFRLLFLTPDGEMAESDQEPRAFKDVFGLPPELELSDIDPARIVAGEVVSGTKGDDVYLAQSAGQAGGYTVVVVAIDTIDLAVLTDAQWLLVGAGLGVLVVAAAVAAWLARRLTRPIGEIEQVAGALASGDLSARAQLGSGTDRELTALADTLNALGSQLESARGAERAFLLSVSHDLRTPLTSIRGYAEALADGTIDEADPEARARAAAIIGGAPVGTARARLAGIVSRGHAGVLPLAPAV
jgi:HAMP domain-containing protein